MFQPTNKKTLILLEANLMLQQWPLLALLVPPEVVRKALVVLGGQRGQQYAKWSGSQRWSHDCRNQVQASDVGQLSWKVAPAFSFIFTSFKRETPCFLCVKIPLKELQFFCCYNLPRGKKAKAFANKSGQHISLARACYYSMCTPQATQTYIYIYYVYVSL